MASLETGEVADDVRRYCTYRDAVSKTSKQ